VKFRKSIKLGKGVRVNIGKKGVSSLSVGGKGATLNVGSKGVKATVGVPGSGISETVKLTSSPNSTTRKIPSNRNKEVTETSGETDAKKVGFLLGFGIVLMPYIFSWFTLRAGYSVFARIVSFSWLAFFIYGALAR